MSIHTVLRILASKCMHYTPLQFSCAAALPENTLASEIRRHVVLLWVGGCEKIMDDSTN